MKQHRFTHLFTFFVLPVLLLFCGGCGGSTPEKAVQNELDLIQKLDEDTITAFISYEDTAGFTQGTSTIGKETVEGVQLFFKDFQYKILSSSATEKTATVNVEITNIDAKALAKDLCTELVARSVSPNGEEEMPGNTNAYFALLRDVLSQHTYQQVTTSAHFELLNSDSGWTIQSTDQLKDELVGGLISYLKDPYLVKPEEILTLAFDKLKNQTPEEWVSYFGMNDIFSTYSQFYQEVDLALAEQLTKYFDYTVVKITEEDKTATASLKITSLDLQKVLDDYLNRLMEYASTTEAVRASDTELADKTCQLLRDALKENSQTIQQTLKVTFQNNGTNWEMNLDENFTNVLLGDINSAIETFQAAALK